MYQHAIKHCTDGHEFMLGWDQARKHDDRSKFLHDVFFEGNFEANVTKFFRNTVADLIQQKSLAYKGSRRSLNVVRDVCNVVPIMWLAQRFAIPLKTDKTPRGLLTVPQLFECYLVLFMYQSFNVLPKNEWKLREGSSKVAPLLRRIFETHLRTQQGFTEGIVDWMAKGSAFEVKPEAERLYHTLNNSTLPVGDLVGDCIGMGAPVAGNLTQQASLLIDLFLSEGYEEYKDRIVEPRTWIPPSRSANSKALSSKACATPAWCRASLASPPKTSQSTTAPEARSPSKPTSSFSLPLPKPPWTPSLSLTRKNSTRTVRSLLTLCSAMVCTSALAQGWWAARLLLR